MKNVDQSNWDFIFFILSWEWFTIDYSNFEKMSRSRMFWTTENDGMDDFRNQITAGEGDSAGAKSTTLAATLFSLITPLTIYDDWTVCAAHCELNRFVKEHLSMESEICFFQHFLNSWERWKLDPFQGPTYSWARWSSWEFWFFMKIQSEKLWLIQKVSVPKNYSVKTF